jgi:hypothetical protein
MVPGFFFLPNFLIKNFANFSKNLQFHTKKKDISWKKNLIFEVEKSTEIFPRTERAWVDRHSHWYHGTLKQPRTRHYRVWPLFLILQIPLKKGIDLSHLQSCSLTLLPGVIKCQCLTSRPKKWKVVMIIPAHWKDVVRLVLLVLLLNSRH